MHPHSQTRLPSSNDAVDYQSLISILLCKDRSGAPLFIINNGDPHSKNLSLREKMERHIQILLNRISCASATIATVILLLLFLQTPDMCLPPGSTPKPHHKFPKSTCDFSHRPLTSLDKKNKRLWATKDWKNKVGSFAALFRDLRSVNYSKVLCVSAGAGHAVMALQQIVVEDVTGVELVDSPPLVSRADPHNLPFFDGVFDLAFSAHLDQALFSSRFAAEMERTVIVGGACVVAVEECGDAAVKEISRLFRKSRFVDAKNVSLIGSKMTRIILRITTAN